MPFCVIKQRILRTSACFSEQKAASSVWLLHKAPFVSVLASQERHDISLDVDRLGDLVGHERGVAEVVGLVLALAPFAPLARDVGVTEMGRMYREGGGEGRGVISSFVKARFGTQSLAYTVL